MNAFRWDCLRSWECHPSKFLSVFTHITAFHAGCPTDPTLYQSHGIELPTVGLYRRLVRETYPLSVYPKLSDKLINGVVDNGSTDMGTLFVGLDERLSVDCCGHYLIYGSETVQGLRPAIENIVGHVPQHAIELKGVPTIVELLLPLALVDEGYLQYLVESISENRTDVRRTKQVPLIDFTVPFVSSIPKECVVKLSHPKEIPDPIVPGQYFCLDVNSGNYQKQFKQIR